MILWLWGIIMTTAAASWMTVNDTVMGGVSSSQVYPTGDGFTFSGVVSTENNGGFASVRKDISKQEFRESSGISIQGEGDSLSYQVVVWMRGYGPRLYYRHVFYPTGTTQFLSYEDFEAISYGRRVQAPPLYQMLDQAYAIGILVGGGYEGEFQLDIQDISLEPYIVEQPSQEMVDSITAAIEKGVPAFNEGNPRKCARIYEDVLTEFLTQDVPVVYKRRFQAVLETAKTVEDPITRAWLFRHALDTVLRLDAISKQ